MLRLTRSDSAKKYKYDNDAKNNVFQGNIYVSIENLYTM